MAKRKKLQDNNPPRRVEIRGQDHLLAYITPEEAQMLMDNGGAGKPGPMGIPAFYGEDPGFDGGGGGSAQDGDDRGRDGGYGEDPGFDGGGGGSAQNNKSGGPSSKGRGGGRASAGMSSSRGFSGGDSDRDFQTDPGASSVGIDVANALTNAQINKAVDSARSILGMSTKSRGLTSAQVDAINAVQRAMQFTPYSETINDPVYSGITSAAIGLGGQDRRLGGLTRAQYGAMPSYMQNVYDKTGAYNFEFGPQGNVTGFYGPPGGSPIPAFNLLGKGIVGLTDMLLGPPMTEDDLALRSGYTGFGEGSQLDFSSRDGGPEDIKPADPITGECEEGYVFDKTLNACRLDTPGVGEATESEDTMDSGVYGRLGLLDVAPVGLSDFYSRYGVQPQDFGAANLDYRRGAGTQFGIYKDPYQKKGYTLLA
jgi:hypothetical protein